jgi:hypothetical protein
LGTVSKKTANSQEHLAKSDFISYFSSAMPLNSVPLFNALRMIFMPKTPAESCVLYGEGRAKDFKIARIEPATLDADQTALDAIGAKRYAISGLTRRKAGSPYAVRLTLTSLCRRSRVWVNRVDFPWLR